MTGRRLRTADYPEERRKRLGSAVADAREALGFKFRPPFAKHAKIALRSLVDLENGAPGVGETNLKAVARALPNWTDETPRAILEGGEIPPTAEIPQAKTLPVGYWPTDAQIIAMSYNDLARFALNLDRDAGSQAAEDWLFHALSVRRDATRRNSTLPQLG